MTHVCDNCGKELGERAYTCQGYTYITCSAGCLAHVMLVVDVVNTQVFFDEER